MSAHDQSCPSSGFPHEHPLKMKLRDDLRLAGLSGASQQSYLAAIDLFFKRTWLTPDAVTERHLADYLRALQDAKVAAGTFKVARYALFFLFQNTLARSWPLFKKRFAPRASSASRTPANTPNA